jgi:hypothetical protein
MTTYELWTHRWTAASYAVRLFEGRVTGVCGPLPAVAREALGDLAEYEYDDRPAALRCARMSPEQFAPAAAWRHGRAERWPPH